MTNSYLFNRFIGQHSQLGFFFLVVLTFFVFSLVKTLISSPILSESVTKRSLRMSVRADGNASPFRIRSASFMHYN